jgi:hypothetical protein
MTESPLTWRLSSINKLICALFCLLMGTVQSSLALDAERYDVIAPGERLVIRMGTFLIDRFDTTARFDSRQFPIGALLDLEDNFDVDVSENVARLDGFYRFSPKHRIDWTYYTSRRDGEAIAQEEYEIGDPSDPEGGFIIPQDAQVATQWNFDLLKLGYAYSFLNKRRYEMYIGAGLNIRKLDIDLSYQAALASSVESDRFAARQLLPLPTGTIGGRWNFNEKWQGNFRYELFMLDLGEYRGSQQEIQLLIEHNTFKNVGLGAGFNLININVRAESENFRGEFDSRIKGIVGYIKIYL